MKEKNKLTKGQIVKICFAVLGAVMILASAVIGMFTNLMPKTLQFLPFPLLIAGIALLLILKTAGKPFIEIQKPTFPEADKEEIEGEPSEESLDSCEKAVEEEKTK